MLDVMGYSQLIFGQSWNVMAFVAAGIIYLVVNAILTVLMRLIERKALEFEHRLVLSHFNRKLGIKTKLFYIIY